jgi:hypothetical protein
MARLIYHTLPTTQSPFVSDYSLLKQISSSTEMLTMFSIFRMSQEYSLNPGDIFSLQLFEFGRLTPNKGIRSPLERAPSAPVFLTVESPDNGWIIANRTSAVAFVRCSNDRWFHRGFAYNQTSGNSGKQSPTEGQSSELYRAEGLLFSG